MYIVVMSQRSRNSRVLRPGAAGRQHATTPTHSAHSAQSAMSRKPPPRCTKRSALFEAAHRSAAAAGTHGRSAWSSAMLRSSPMRGIVPDRRDLATAHDLRRRRSRASRTVRQGCTHARGASTHTWKVGLDHLEGDCSSCALRSSPCTITPSHWREERWLRQVLPSSCTAL